MKLKHWLIITIAITLLCSCTSVSTRTVSIEDKLPRKIEKQLEGANFKENTGFKLFSNNKDTYYIIYDTTKQVDGLPVIWETEDDGVIIKINNGKELDTLTRYIYKIKRSPLYDSIEIEKNGLPSSFDLSGSF